MDSRKDALRSPLLKPSAPLSKRKLTREIEARRHFAGDKKIVFKRFSPLLASDLLKGSSTVSHSIPVLCIYNFFGPSSPRRNKRSRQKMHASRVRERECRVATLLGLIMKDTMQSGLKFELTVINFCFWFKNFSSNLFRKELWTFRLTTTGDPVVNRRIPTRIQSSIEMRIAVSKWASKMTTTSE